MEGAVLSGLCSGVRAQGGRAQGAMLGGLCSRGPCSVVRAQEGPCSGTCSAVAILKLSATFGQGPCVFIFYGSLTGPSTHTEACGPQSSSE